MAPQPPTLRLSALHALNAWRRDPIGLLERAASSGDVVRVRLPRLEVWLLNHPDHIRDVLVTRHHDFMKGPTMQAAKWVLGENLLTSEGDVHRRQRRLIQPIFHHDRIEQYGAVMVQHAERVSERWRNGQTVDTHHEMASLTLSVVGRALFDTDVEADEAKAIGHALSVTLANFPRIFSPLFSFVMRLPLPKNREVDRARAVLDSTIDRMIADRRAAGLGGTDLLSLLVAAKDEGTVGITDDQVKGEAMTLLLAGHETTAVALTWTWYLLSQHPEVEEKLHAELNELLGGRAPSAEDVPRLRYTSMVLSESMRLYPPAWAIGRRTLSDHSVNGYVVPKDAVVVVSPYLVHHDARWWPEPLEFRPERWEEQDDRSRPRLAYFPFGAGPRMCIGEPFAWMEALLVLATLAQRWRLRLVPDQRIELQPAITLRPKHGMAMTVERRMT